MHNSALIDYIRNLVPHLREQGEMNEQIVEALEQVQAQVEGIYTQYESESPPTGAETLRELTLEALQLIFQGVEELLIFAEDLNEDHLSSGLSLVEAGREVMNSIKQAVGQASSVALGS